MALVGLAAARDVVVTDSIVSVPVAAESLTIDERYVLDRLVEVVRSDAESMWLRRKPGHTVGRCVVGRWTVTVPPAFDPDILLGLVLYAYRIDLNAIQQAKLVSAPMTVSSGLDLFLRMMAAILVSEAQRIASRHIAQEWEPVVERSHNPKGRLLWAADFGRDPGAGITHLHHVKTTDNRLNRLILSGLRAATGYLSGTGLNGEANRQAFIWRELATETPPRPIDFELAISRLTRMTDHYQSGVALSRALVLGLSPEDYFSSAQDPALPGLRFPLPSIFERFMERLLREIAVGNPRLAVAAQAPDRSALVDETGQTYREVRPDLELQLDFTPRAVIDAKFKPQYVAASRTAKVSTADAFQLLFYQARATQRANGRVVPAAIVAPQLDDLPMPSDWPREVIWRQVGTPDQGVALFALPLKSLLERLRLEPASQAIRAAPEFASFLEREWLTPV